ncbi:MULTISPECIES: LysR family transcriptional regulator [Marinomonas]|uniref:LysR family transcriptional regulator n=1 Tax=Marinomonas rhodophyticola TaxID=2992803 RepID=A0ABT3KEU7_9GAMM|nr:LysR family transcriptional regulator [Marinomonas sp. KJ51-3]MCW4629068.1 LysR family transcriptional regulator [Marinomonas sp. KJ51-3]
MNTRHLKTLLAIHKYGTFSQAAEKVNLTAAAVGQQVVSLEQELRTELFDRSTRPPTFTPQGLQVVEMANKIIRLEEDTKLSLRGDLISGTLMIGSVRSSAVNVVPGAMVKMRSKYPDLKTNLRIGLSSQLVSDVASGHLDAAIIAEHISIPQHLNWQPFLDEPLWVVLPEDMEVLPLKEMLNEYPFIRFKSAVPLANVIDTELSSLGVITSDVAEVDTINALITCVRSGLGITIVPHMFLQEPEMASLKKIEFGSPQISRKIGIVERINNPRKVIIEELHNHLAEQCGSHGIPRVKGTA